MNRTTVASIVVPVLVVAAFGAQYFGARHSGNKNPLKSVEPTRHSSPIVVELFTSEGCSSCPPADSLLTTLEKTQPVGGANIIALEEHVAYWNRLGWQDPFSSELFSQRQEGYSSRLGSEVYTPQMVVDGKSDVVGSDSQQARQAIAGAVENPKADVTLALDTTSTQRNSSPTLSISAAHIPNLTSGDRMEVVVAVTEDRVSSSVTAGENSGRNLVHTAVVRSLTKLATENTTSAEGKLNIQTPVAIQDSWNRGNLRVVVLLQEQVSRRILGAAVQSFSTELQP